MDWFSNNLCSIVLGFVLYIFEHAYHSAKFTERSMSLSMYSKFKQVLFTLIKVYDVLVELICF